MNVSVPVSVDSTKIATKLIKQNALNRTGQMDFNKYGMKDGGGLIPCSEIFIDNFILEIVVPDYLVVGGKYVEAPTATKLLWSMLKESKLAKTKTTTIHLARMRVVPTSEKIEMILFKRLDMKTDSYYSQQFKVACANENMEAVVEFLEKKDYCQRSFYLKDIDVTQDFSGSFSKQELIDYLLETDEFRMQGSGLFTNDYSFTILDNNSTVGNNCLTYCGQAGPFRIRCKVYNKMVQMLESKCVREKIGNHLFSWANQMGTRLAEARDSSKKRGLTRVEATIYCGQNVPSTETLCSIVKNVTNQIKPELVYSTPFFEMWRSYCENLFHSLIVVDKSLDRAFVVYSFNEMTEKISGHVFHNWSKNQKWITANLTLNGVLPIDCILFEPTATDEQLFDCAYLKIEGKRFFKYTKGYGTDFKMRLVHTNALYSIATAKTTLVHTGSSNSDYTKCYTDGSDKRLENSGLIACETCIPYLSYSAANKKSAVDVQFSDSIEIDVQFNWGSRTNNFKRKIFIQEKLLQIKKQKNELSIQLSSWAAEKKHLNLLKKAYKKSNHVALSSLVGERLEILAVRETATKLFGTKFSLILTAKDGKNINCYANKSIEDQIIQQLLGVTKQQIKVGPSNYFSLQDKPLGIVTITKEVRWLQRKNKQIICYVDLFNVTRRKATEKSPTTGTIEEGNIPTTSRDVQASGTEVQPAAINIETERFTSGTYNSDHDGQSDLELSTFDCLLAYKDLPNLATQTIGGKFVIVAKSLKSHRGKSKLVVKLSDGFYYQAGKDLEQKDESGSIIIPQNFVIRQTKIDVATRKREAVCVLVS